MSSLAAKQFSDFAYFDVHFQGFIGIREVYKLLYYLFPTLNWHFIANMIYSFSALYFLLGAIRLVLTVSKTSLGVIFIVQLFFAIAFIENISFISHTRVSLIFCGVALVNLAFKPILENKDYLFNMILFGFGLLLRPESSMGTLLLVSAGFMIYKFDLKKYFLRFSGPIGALIIFLTIFTIDLYNTTIYSRKIEPEIEYSIMAERILPLSEMLTARDSAKRDAAFMGMWFDMKEMSPEYLRSIIIPGIDLSAKNIQKALKHLIPFFAYYSFYLVTVFGFILISLGLLSNKLLFFTRHVLLFAFTFVLLYTLDHNGLLLDNRHFLSLVLIALLIHCYYFFDSLVHAPKNKIVQRLFTVCLLVSLVYTFYTYKQENELAENSLHDMEKTMKGFEEKYTGKIVAITIDNRFLFDQHFSLDNRIYTKNTYIMFDWFTFHLTPRYMDYLNHLCNCDSENPVAFFDWLSKNKALYLSSPYRYDLTKRYMKAVHNYELNFGSAVNVNSLGNVKHSGNENCEIRVVR